MPERRLFSVFVLLLVCTVILHSQDLKRGTGLLQKRVGSRIDSTRFNINNISTLIFNNGITDRNNNNHSGFVYPKGSGKTAVYCSGLLWGAKVKGRIECGGSKYYPTLTPGKIMPDGKAEDPTSPNVRIYRTRRDFRSNDLRSEIDDGEGTYNEIYSKYRDDWDNWPWKDGAPFEDKNGDGFYDPGIDIPGIPGADQTIWFAANDLDSNLTKEYFGCSSMGIELQCTIWGYESGDPLSRTLFRRYLVINKSEDKFSDIYFGIWADADIGDAVDDFIGCDTLINLGYTYNSKAVDAVYQPLSPPAVGFCLLEGPVVPVNGNDKARYKFHDITGMKNLPMTSFCDPSYYDSDPYGETDPYFNSLYLYNFLQGLTAIGSPFPIPPSLGGGRTRFPYSGDPSAKTGFLDGMVDAAGDRSMMLGSGPFNMSPGDTQEVVIAEIAAGTINGDDYLGADATLKKDAYLAAGFFHDEMNLRYHGLQPSVQASGLDKEVVLNWGSDHDRSNFIENSKYLNYGFAGYNIYQILAGYSTYSNKKIASFNVKEGVYSGMQRFISIKQDALRNESLNDGQNYRFGVSGYFYDPDALLNERIFESEISCVDVVPQPSRPGLRYTSNFGDLINATHISGNSSALVEAMIIDPSKVNGDEYEITFTVSDGNIKFGLRDFTLNKTVLTDQSNLAGDYDYYVTDGFILRVKVDQNNSLKANDIYRFTAPFTTFDLKQLESDVKSVNVFPNPYYGANRDEINKYERIMTFSHLPQRAVIRIFNLAGQLIRKLEKDSGDQYFKWDLRTENNHIVPGGVYIAQIDMPDLGKSKILKLAVVPEEIIPDKF